MVFGIIPECRLDSLRNKRSASPEYPVGGGLAVEIDTRGHVADCVVGEGLGLTCGQGALSAAVQIVPGVAGRMSVRVDLGQLVAGDVVGILGFLKQRVHYTG